MVGNIGTPGLQVGATVVAQDRVRSWEIGVIIGAFSLYLEGPLLLIPYPSQVLKMVWLYMNAPSFLCQGLLKYRDNRPS